MSEEIAYECGYDCMGDMMVDNLTRKEINDMLREYIQEDETGIVEDIIMEIAIRKYNWVDHEGAKAVAEDVAYQAHKDREE